MDCVLLSGMILGQVCDVWLILLVVEVLLIWGSWDTTPFQTRGAKEGENDIAKTILIPLNWTCNNCYKRGLPLTILYSGEGNKMITAELSAPKILGIISYHLRKKLNGTMQCGSVMALPSNRSAHGWKWGICCQQVIVWCWLRQLHDLKCGNIVYLSKSRISPVIFVTSHFKTN